MSTYLSTLRPGVGRATREAGEWRTTTLLAGVEIRCLAAHRGDVYAGGDGVWRSADAGLTWRRAGLDGAVVTCLHSDGDRLLAGTRPTALFASTGAGPDGWTEIEGFRRAPGRWWWRSPAEPPPFQACVQGMAVRGEEMVVGIEAGAVLRSPDRGRTWSRHLPRSIRDCHSLIAGPGGVLVEGGGTGGGARSDDFGRTWSRPRGVAKRYGWASAVDPVEPGTWYFSAARDVRAHSDHADATIYRVRMSGSEASLAEPLAGGLPAPLNSMPYGLLAGPAGGRVLAGLANGELWESVDWGETWTPMEARLPGIERALLEFD